MEIARASRWSEVLQNPPGMTWKPPSAVAVAKTRRVKGAGSKLSSRSTGMVDLLPHEIAWAILQALSEHLPFRRRQIGE